MTRFPRDRFDDVADGPRVGAHRAVPRRGRGWIAFGIAALATVALVAIGLLLLSIATNGTRFTESSSASASASSSATSKASASPASTAAASASEQGSTTLWVLNGTTTAGLAAAGTETLHNAGWTVKSDGNAGSTDATTSIVYYQKASDAAVARGVAKTIGVTDVEQSTAFPNADVTVVLGADFGG